MKNFILIAFAAILLFAANSATAQDYHCRKAWRKDWKTDKKESKIHKKMFTDHYRKAWRKRAKAERKAYKSERKEYDHRHTPVHDRYW
jgi:hypothetical protein